MGAAGTAAVSQLGCTTKRRPMAVVRKNCFQTSRHSSSWAGRCRTDTGSTASPAARAVASTASTAPRTSST